MDELISKAKEYSQGECHWADLVEAYEAVCGEKYDAVVKKGVKHYYLSDKCIMAFSKKQPRVKIYTQTIIADAV